MQKPLLGYVVAALIGAAVSIVVGYLVHAAPGDGFTFGWWIGSPFRYGVHLWAIAGLLAGTGFKYAFAR